MKSFLIISSVLVFSVKGSDPDPKTKTPDFAFALSEPKLIIDRPRSKLIPRYSDIKSVMALTSHNTLVLNQAVIPRGETLEAYIADLTDGRRVIIGINQRKRSNGEYVLEAGDCQVYEAKQLIGGKFVGFAESYYGHAKDEKYDPKEERKELNSILEMLTRRFRKQ